MMYLPDDDEHQRRVLLVVSLIDMVCASFLLICTSLTFTDNTILCTPRSSLDTETEARLANIQARGIRRPLVLSLAALAVLGFGATAPFIQTPLRELAALTALFTALFLAWTFYMPRLEVGSAEERIRLVPAAAEGVAAQTADEPLFKHWPRWGGIVLLLLADCCILLGATNPFLWY